VDAAIVVEALYIGTVYALIALGFTIIFAPTHVVNFAQGEYLVLGAAGAYQFQAVWGWHPLLMIAAVVGAAVVLGLLTERMIMLPVRLSGSRFAWIIATLAAALILQATFSITYRETLFRTPPLVRGRFELFGVGITYQQAIIVVGALAIMIAYDRFLKGTTYGRAIRAAAHDPDTVQLMGVNVNIVVIVSFVLGSVITAIAGVLAAPTVFVEPAGGLLFTIKGFVAIVIGGMGSARGALAGGLIVGVLDTVVRNMVGATVGNMVVVAVLAIILVTFPSGLFGKPIRGH
jgi:branched-chain amino acid transport system permease protein